MDHDSSARSIAGQTEAPLTVGRPELLRDGDDAQFRQLVHDLLAFSARLQEIRDGLASLIDLSGPAYTVLISVAHLAPHDEVRVTTVAQHLKLSQPYVTAQVSDLVALGLLDKVASNIDRRSVSLTVTPKGQALLAELAPRQRQINDQLFSQLSSTAFDDLATTTSHLVSDADRALELAALHVDREHALRQATG